MSDFEERKYLSDTDLKRLEEKKLLEKDDEGNLQIDTTDFVAIFIAAIQTIFLPVIITFSILIVLGISFGIIIRILGIV
ncbi:MAG: hypothetical protein ACFFDI_15605 [Promethearchaeota archaeon]